LGLALVIIGISVLTNDTPTPVAISHTAQTRSESTPQDSPDETSHETPQAIPKPVSSTLQQSLPQTHKRGNLFDLDGPSDDYQSPSPTSLLERDPQRAKQLWLESQPVGAEQAITETPPVTRSGQASVSLAAQEAVSKADLAKHDAEKQYQAAIQKIALAEMEDLKTAQRKALDKNDVTESIAIAAVMQQVIASPPPSHTEIEQHPAAPALIAVPALAQEAVSKANLAKHDAEKRYQATIQKIALAEMEAVMRQLQNVIAPPKDEVQEVRKAADAGDANAMNNIGFRYEQGYGVTKDYQEAMKWFRKAADAGDAEAMTNIGWLYEHGYGVTKDREQATYWYRKSAALGSSFAKFRPEVLPKQLNIIVRADAWKTDTTGWQAVGEMLPGSYIVSRASPNGSSGKFCTLQARVNSEIVNVTEHPRIDVKVESLLEVRAIDLSRNTGEVEVEVARFEHKANPMSLTPPSHGEVENEVHPVIPVGQVGTIYTQAPTKRVR
jgi:hypothetical protein